MSPSPAAIDRLPWNGASSQVRTQTVVVLVLPGAAFPGHARAAENELYGSRYLGALRHPPNGDHRYPLQQSTAWCPRSKTSALTSRSIEMALTVEACYRLDLKRLFKSGRVGAGSSGTGADRDGGSTVASWRCRAPAGAGAAPAKKRAWSSVAFLERYRSAMHLPVHDARRQGRDQGELLPALDSTARDWVVDSARASFQHNEPSHGWHGRSPDRSSLRGRIDIGGSACLAYNNCLRLQETALQ